MSEKYSVIIEERAYEDLKNIFFYIAKDSPLIASRIYEELLEQMRTLDTFPERHQKILIVLLTYFTFFLSITPPLLPYIFIK